MSQRSANARQLYRDPAFKREDMQAKGVTCLAARLSFGHETYGRPLVQGLVDAINLHLEGQGVVHPNLAASNINTAGLAQDYASMLTAYDKTNILDQTTLDKIAKASGVRYLAVPILVNFKEGGSNRVSAFGLRLVKTSWATTRFQLQIWDGASGRVVWEGISDLTLAQEVILERPVRFEDIVFETWASLVEHIPTQHTVKTPSDPLEQEEADVLEPAEATESVDVAERQPKERTTQPASLPDDQLFDPVAPTPAA